MQNLKRAADRLSLLFHRQKGKTNSKSDRGKLGTIRMLGKENLPRAEQPTERSQC